MNDQWQCSSCGKQKQISARRDLTEYVSDCWPCARKRKFVRILLGTAIAAPATSDPSSTAMFPSTAAADDASMGERARSGNTSSSAAVNGPGVTASEAYAAWATSRIGHGAVAHQQPQGRTDASARTPNVSASVFESARSSSALRRAAAHRSRSLTQYATEPSASFTTVSMAHARPPTLSPPLSFARTPLSGTPSSAVVPPLPAEPQRGRPRGIVYGVGGAAPAFAGPFLAVPRSRSAGFDPVSDSAPLLSSEAAAVGESIAAVEGGGDVDGKWLCEVCHKPKALAGPHLAGKTSVRSDCWPCAKKRLFRLTPSSNTGGSLEGAADSMMRSPTPMAMAEAVMPVPSPLVTATGFDANDFLRLVTMAQRAQLVREFSSTLHGASQLALGGIVRPCPPTKDEYPMLYAIEFARFGDMVQLDEAAANATATTTGGRTTGSGGRVGPRLSGGGSPFTALSPVRISAGSTASTWSRPASPERAVAAASVASLANLAARAATSVLHAASLLAASSLNTATRAVRVGVFCNTHDELAALAAYFALTEDPDSSMVFEVMGPPPEFTTSRTVATNVLAHLKSAGLGRATVSPPVTHDERHWAVKHIARRSQGLVLSPGSVLGFVVAERAHAAWKASGDAPPDVSLVLLGRPARWDELPRVIQVVQALKESLA